MPEKCLERGLDDSFRPRFPGKSRSGKIKLNYLNTFCRKIKICCYF